MDKKNTWAISKLMNFYMHLNELNKACNYLEKLHKINKDSDTHKLALFIIQEGRILQNEEKFDLARNKFPGDVRRIDPAELLNFWNEK